MFNREGYVSISNTQKLEKLVYEISEVLYSEKNANLRDYISSLSLVEANDHGWDGRLHSIVKGTIKKIKEADLEEGVVDFAKRKILKEVDIVDVEKLKKFKGQLQGYQQIQRSIPVYKDQPAIRSHRSIRPSLHHNIKTIIDLIKSNNPKLIKVDLSEKNLSRRELKLLRKAVLKGDMIGNIKFGKIEKENEVIVQEIEEKLILNNSKFRYYPSDYVYGLLSLHSYEDSKEGDKVILEGHPSEYTEGWLVHKVFQDKKSGYYGIIYRNDITCQTVLAHRGITLEFKDLLKNNSTLKSALEGPLGGAIVTQQVIAYAAAFEAVEWSKENGYSFSTTGHTLGAWLAELTAYSCHYDLGYPQVKAVTFDSPGSLSMMKQLKSNIENNISQVDRKKINIVTYLSVPNPINSCNKHVGRVYRVFPELKLPEWIEKVNSKIEKVPLLGGQVQDKIEKLRIMLCPNLSLMLECFDPKKGKPKEYEEVLDWPCMNYKEKTSIVMDGADTLIETGLSFIPFNQHVPEFVENIITSIAKKAINKTVHKFIGKRTAVSLINVLWDFVSDNIDKNQCWNYLKYADKENEYRVKELDSTKDRFSLIYKGHYRGGKADEYSDRLHPEGGTVDWFIYTIKELADLISLNQKISSVYRAQIKELVSNYTLERNDYGLNIKTKSSVRVEDIKQQIKRLFYVAPELKEQLNLSHLIASALSESTLIKRSNVLPQAETSTAIEQALENNTTPVIREQSVEEEREVSIIEIQTSEVAELEKEYYEEEIVNNLKQHYAGYNRLERYIEDGREYKLTDSYINLVILQKEEVKDKEQKLKKEKDKEEGIRDERIDTYESLYETKKPIELEKLFNIKGKAQGVKKLVIYGRAGVGKTTLCQYISVLWQESKLWNDKFKGVIWLPLRKVAAEMNRIGDISIGEVIREICIDGIRENKPSVAQINRFIRDNKEKLLFILDGYDEVEQILNTNEGRKLNSLLKQLLTDDLYIITTSRPMQISKIGTQPIKFDYELENIGFTNENIISYVKKFMPEENEKIVNFLQTNKSIWGIAHIPINLELICCVWEELSHHKQYTMTKLYNEIVKKLLARYVGKFQDSMKEDLTESALIEKSKGVVEQLERLAIEGMKSNKVIISKEAINKALGGRISEVLKTGIVKRIGEEVYFLHLTFQEYFAASYIAKGLEEVGSDRYKESVATIREHKYTPYYEIMWWFTAGILYERGKVNNNYIALTRLWHEIESHPRELVGIRHMSLQIRCLDECEADEVVETNNLILGSIKQWFNKDNFRNFHLFEDCLRLSSGVNSKVIPIIIEYLNIIDNNTWSWVAEVLGKIGGAHADIVIPALINTLKDGDEHVKFSASIALGKVGIGHGNTVIPALVNVLKDTDEDARNGAVEALGKIGGAHTDVVIPALINTLKGDTKYWVRIRAAKALGQVGVGHEITVVPALVNALKDTDDLVKKGAVEGLGQVGAGHANIAVPALVNALKDRDPFFLGGLVVCALGKIGLEHADIAVPVLINALEDSNPWVRIEVAKVLNKIGRMHLDIILPVLINALEDSNPWVRIEAAKVLNKIGRMHLDIILPVLINALEDSNPWVRIEAAKVLNKIGRMHLDIVLPALLEALKDENHDIRYRAAEALGKVGAGHEDMVVPYLINALEDSDEYVRLSASIALARIGGRNLDIVAYAINALESSDTYIMSRVVEGLGQVGVGHEDIVLPVLINALESSDAYIASRAAEALVKIGVGQEERVGYNIAEKITNSRDITEISNVEKNIIPLYCFKHSSNQLWIAQFLENSLKKKSHIIFNRNTLIVKDLGRLHKIPLTENQKKIFIETMKESAKKKGLSTEVYDYYLGQGTLGFRNEVGIIEKTELHKAAERGDLEGAKSILAQGRIDINDQSNEYKETPLMLAAQNGHWNVVDFLVKNNAEVNCFNQKASGERKNVIGILTDIYEKHDYWLQSYNRINQLLTAAKARPFNDNVQVMSEDRKLAFLKALGEDSFNQIDVLLRNDNRDINYYLDENHTTLLMYAVKTRASNNIIYKLIQSGASLTQLNKSNQNAFAICKKEIAKLTGAMSKDNIKGCLELLIKERKPVSEARLNQVIEKLLNARLSGNNSDDILDKVVSELTGCSSVAQYLNNNELRDIYRLHLGNILAIKREHRGETKVEGNEAIILLSMRIYLYIKLLLEMEQGRETKYIKPAQLRSEILTTLETLNNERVRNLIDGMEISNKLRQTQASNIVEQIKNLQVGEEYSCQSGYQLGETQAGHCLYVSFAKIEENKIVIRIDNRWIKAGRDDGKLHGKEPWSKGGSDNIPKIKSYLVGAANLNDGREVEKLKEYIEKVIQAISKTMSSANAAISYIYKAKFTTISNQSEIATLTGHWSYHDRQSDGNGNCTMSSHNLGVSVRNGKGAFIELCNYEKSEIWIDVETTHNTEHKNPVTSNARLRGESTSSSWSERIKPTEGKESNKDNISGVSNASSFSHTALMKRFQSALGCSWEDVYSGIVVEQSLVGVSGITTPQTGACYRSRDVEGTMITTFGLRFGSKGELYQFINFYNSNFPDLIVNENLKYQVGKLTEIKMDTRKLYEDVVESIRDKISRIQNNKVTKDRECILS